MKKQNYYKKKNAYDKEVVYTILIAGSGAVGIILTNIFGLKSDIANFTMVAFIILLLLKLRWILKKQ